MAHQIVQIKWLHSDGFRRFELEQPSYERLKEAIKCRISSFQSGICYTDAEGDKILITSELDFRDMLKYFRKSTGADHEVVVKIQTNDLLGCRCARESPAAAVTSSTPSSSRSKHLQRKIEVIELLESADESNNPRAVVGTEQQLRLRQKNPVGVFANLLGTGTDDTASASQLHQQIKESDLMKAFMDNLSKNERNEERQGHTSLQLEEQNTSELQAGPSSWFDIGISPELNANFAWNQNERTTANVKGGAGVDAELVQVGLTEAISNFEQFDHRKWSKRKAVSNLINCSLCGSAVTNEHSSLKLHANLHHLKLPIFSCKYCWKVEHKFSRANMLRHMQREHPDRPETDFEHNSNKYRAELLAKIDECFPEAATERRKRADEQQQQ